MSYIKCIIVVLSNLFMINGVIYFFIDLVDEGPSKEVYDMGFE